ncbi:Na+/H+ antiporter NhaC family protein [Sinirhodobacter huangdaonensis]|uniref:Na+/H+ antiporter NhaC family protein n=1 Tax=Paenirhodobacter huangdaonensis TaxID=2501515 RepID=A0A3S4MD79_9RHOB|nr:Na+/H+ antiporter NhaC family protein [Sinirhodobacter huangdaonensis]RWR48397.1 Na+/H+ antiporter NhaC family protein [Sinirhodobacter huangdaonensis]
MNQPSLQFRGGLTMAFLPPVLFLISCFLYFVVFKAFDMTALAMGGFVSLLIGALFAKTYKEFWVQVLKGIGSESAVAITVILFMVGMISALIKATGVAIGFVWLAQEFGLNAGYYTLFVFISVGVISMATGSSIGTMFTAFPIFYAAGITIGAAPAPLAGAILSAAILGDNLAPISDTTIISSSSQRFRSKDAVADVGGVVRHRARYALVAAAISAVLYLVIGMSGAQHAGLAQFSAEASPLPLLMLIPVAIMLIVAMLSRDIFLAVTVGLILGSLTGLASSLLNLSDIVGVKDGTPSGFLYAGVNSMLGTVALVISVFGIMGVLRGAGVMELIITKLSTGSLASTPRGVEWAIGLGVSATTLLFGGVNSAAMLTFGPIADELGARVGLHPYRRANVMDCFALGLASVVPVLSAYLFIGALLTSGYDQAPAQSTFALFPVTIYPLALTAVMIVAVVTGWGRRFEATDSSASKIR